MPAGKLYAGGNLYLTMSSRADHAKHPTLKHLQQQVMNTHPISIVMARHKQNLALTYNHYTTIIWADLFYEEPCGRSPATVLSGIDESQSDIQVN